MALVMTERALRRLPRHDRPHRLDVIGAILMVGAATVADAGAGLGRQALSVDLLRASSRCSAPRPRCGACSRCGLDCERTVYSAGHPARPGHFGDHLRGVLFDRHDHRHHDLHAAILPDRARRFGELSGLALIAFMVGTVCGSQVTARLMVRLTRYLRLPMVGLAIAVTALAVLAADPAGHSIGKFVFLLFALGCGLGPMYPMSTILMQNAVKPHQMGTATGTLNFFRTLGGAIIVAVFGAIVLSGVGGEFGGDDA